ncbi:hypothetical protein R6Q59_014458 [Mikania micrantha]
MYLACLLFRASLGCLELVPGHVLVFQTSLSRILKNFAGFYQNLAGGLVRLLQSVNSQFS